MPNIYNDPEAFGLKAFGDVDFSSGCYEFDRLAVWTDQAGQFLYAEDSGCSCPEPFWSIDLRNVTRATPHEIAARLQAKRWEMYGCDDDNDPKYGHDAMVELIERLMVDRPAMVPAAGKVLGYVVATRDGDEVTVDYAGHVEDTPQAAQQWCNEPGDFIVAVCEVTP